VPVGKFGKALAFNGSNAFVTIPDAAAFHLTTSMTIEAWSTRQVATSDGGTSSTKAMTITILRDRPRPGSGYWH
jgi:hypothetical protein